MKKYPIYSVQNFSRNDVHRDFYVNTFKEHLKSHSFVEEPHRHDSYLMVFFTKGSGLHEIDFDQFEIKRGSLLCCSQDKCIIGVYLKILKVL